MAALIADWLLIIAVILLIPLTITLFKNRWTLLPLPERRPENTPSLSVLMPARNEENQIRQTVSAACKLNYPSIEVLVLNDQSEDRTGAILNELKQLYPGRLKVIYGKSRPEGWLGKPWACQQLAEEASGELLLFIDADVTLEEETANHLVTAFQSTQADMITVWPRQELGSFWERVVIPIIYHSLLTLLPSSYVHKAPFWIPAFLYRRLAVLFAAACGQFIAYKKEAYWRADGHHAVRGEVVEDVELARAARRNRLHLRMFEGGSQISCRMYTSGMEIWDGLRKNFFAGFGYRWSLFLTAGLTATFLYLYPFLVLPVSLLAGNSFQLLFSTTAVLLILLQRIHLARWFRWNPLYSWTHPLAVLWFQALGLRVMWDRLRGIPAYWKGRKVS
ncbi:MAG: glycosyltransferase family 2 protein [Balneolaceae bacterium]